MPISTEILKKYLSTVFVETGSHTGDGIKSAVDAGFDLVVSIELSEKWYNHCRQRFPRSVPDAENITLMPKYSNVFLIKGDSGDLLGGTLNILSAHKCTIWLDGHWSGGDTAKGIDETPLLRELHCIARTRRNSHTILIDDMRCWTRESVGFDKTDLVNIVKVINPRYNISFIDGVDPSGGFFKDDILVATTL